MENLERVVQVRPAYDKRPKKPEDPNYGVHGADLIFGLKGESGAIQFIIYTNWHLPGVNDEMYSKHPSWARTIYGPSPADVGYHSLIPRYEGQTQTSEACEWLNGKPCYYDGSGLHADKVFNIMVAEGHEAMWRYLEGYYYKIFPQSEFISKEETEDN